MHLQESYINNKLLASAFYTDMNHQKLGKSYRVSEFVDLKSHHFFLF